MVKPSFALSHTLTAGVLSFAASEHLGAAPPVKTQKKPNIVFFFIDDLGWKDLGCFGAKLYETPNIDKLCAQGIKFPQAYCSAPICSPSRASVMTGKHPMKLGMWSFTEFIPREKAHILPAFLKKAGYQTWHIGKWHFGTPRHHTMPTDLGFDVNIGGDIAWGPGSYFWPYGCTPDGKPLGHRRNCIPPLVKGGHKGEYLADRLSREALKLIEQRDPSRPFFLDFWTYSVHKPFYAKKKTLEKYQKKIAALGLKKTYRIDPATGAKLVTSEVHAKYAAMIEEMDAAVGRIVDKLKEIGEFEHTFFVFYSDNGPVTDSVPCVPLNGGKNSTYEAGIRVPAFMVWPGHIKPGTTYEHVVYLPDVFDTILDVAGIEKPAGYDGDGLSLLPVFKGERLPPRTLIWYFPDDRHKWAQRANAAIYDEATGYKYIMFFTGDKDELYNLRADLAEKHNIIDQHPDIARQLHDKLAAFLRKYYAGMLIKPKEKYLPYIEKQLNLRK